LRLAHGRRQHQKHKARRPEPKQFNFAALNSTHPLSKPSTQGILNRHRCPRGFGLAKPNSEVRSNTAFGVLKLTLYKCGYDWEFVPVAGKQFTDSGPATCHAK